MKSLLGLVVSKSTETQSDANSYSTVAAEYYDEALHPTCADFRDAARLYLQKLFRTRSPRGRMADIGCGRSLLAEFVSSNFVLVDQSSRMLSLNGSAAETRLIDVEKQKFGESEFDWVFAILADPYNTLNSWKNIRESMVPNGYCIFIVPSLSWAAKFRNRAPEERSDFARFVMSNKHSIYLRSLIMCAASQTSLIKDAGLRVIAVEHVLRRDLPHVRSPKISAYLAADEAVLDVYVVVKA